MPYRRVKELREDADLTQKQIAEFVHLSTISYIRYERGEREIPFDAAIKLAKHYNVSLDYLAGLTDKPR